MKNEMIFVLSFYNEKVSQMIVEKYGIEPLTALRKFIFSETYRMLTDEELEMWDFKIKDFGEQATEEWVRFEMNNRNRFFDDIKNELCN